MKRCVHHLRKERDVYALMSARHLTRVTPFPASSRMPDHLDPIPQAGGLVHRVPARINRTRSHRRATMAMSTSSRKPERRNLRELSLNRPPFLPRSLACRPRPDSYLPITPILENQPTGSAVGHCRSASAVPRLSARVAITWPCSIWPHRRRYPQRNNSVSKWPKD